MPKNKCQPGDKITSNNKNYICQEVLSTGTLKQKAYLTGCLILPNGDVLTRSPEYLAQNWTHDRGHGGSTHAHYKYGAKSLTKSGWARELGISPTMITWGIKMYGSVKATIKHYKTRRTGKTSYTGVEFVAPNGRLVKHDEAHYLREWPDYCGVNYNTFMARRRRLRGKVSEQEAFNTAITKLVGKIGRKNA